MGVHVQVLLYMHMGVHVQVLLYMFMVVDDLIA